MLKVELIPDLTYCIETVANREHAAVLKQLLKPGQGNKELEEKLEILRLFLETADFRKLRTESEKRFMEGRKIKFVVYLENDVKYEMQVT
ncbi:hypothetical protein ACFLUU_08590 [Chloroflexota bacterium]